MAASEWKTVTRDPPYSVFSKPIQKSQQDDRDYRLIRLENGLQACLIHDPKADKAAASLDVAVGHLHDPDDMPGLAHFCEHLLFMGTEQYPRENEYSELLAKSNGSSNAYTSTSNTNYYFSVSTQALAPALARFAAFFHCPLFAPSCTSRELNAIDSEHKKNHQSDMWRIFQLNKTLSKHGHVWHKFGSGTRQTLSQAGKELKAKGKLNGSSSVNGASQAATPIPSRLNSPAPSIVSSGSEGEADGGSVGRETRRRLVEWWNREYCAGRMRLCVIGKEPLDDLADLVSNLFSPILNRGQDPLPMIHDHPFGPNEMGTLVSVKTIMAFHAVEVSFPLSFQPPLWKYKPANFLAHFVGHEGPGSLHSYLKQKGWCTTLNCGAQNLARGFAMFKNTIHLTQEGFQNHRAVILAMFKYLALLRSSSFPAWYQSEIAKISATRFLFQEKGSPDTLAVRITEHMSWPLPPELIISGPQVVREWDGEDGEEQVREILEGLTVKRGRAVLMARGEEHEKVSKGEWMKEKWYGTEYRVVQFDEQFIREAEGPNDIEELFLPGPNEFIPTNLDVDKREVDQPAKRPHLIRETPLTTLWHKKDDQFWVPKGQVIIDIRSTLANNSPRSAVLTRLYSDLVNDSLTEFTYDADLAGLKYNFAFHGLGIWISLNGYNDKLAVLVHHVLGKAKNIVVTKERLEVMKDQLHREWTNFFLGALYRVTDYYGKYLLSETWALQDKLREVMSVTPEEMQSHISALMGNVHMQLLVSGNIYKDEAIKIAEMVEGMFPASPLPANAVRDRALILPKACNYVWDAPIANPNEPNSCITYYVHIGPATDRRTRVTSALLTQILSEPAFNILRTQEQLGYIVSCGTWTLSGAGHLGIRIVVQSERGPNYLEERIEKFLEGMEGMIREMDEKAFEEQKDGLERKWREKYKNLSEETTFYWTQVESGYLDFYRHEQDADFLATLTQQDVLDLFMSAVHPASPNRAKLSVHMHSQKPRPKKIGHAAAQAFEAFVKTSGVLIPDRAGGWQDEQDGEPTVDEYVAHWKGLLEQQAKVAELLAAIPALVEKYPAEGEGGADKRREGAAYIEDVDAFKKGLQVSADPKPLVEWGDLPVAKF